MNSLALMSPSPQSDSRVYHLDPEAEIERLQHHIEKLEMEKRRLQQNIALRREDRKKIVVRSEVRGTFIRNMAQEYFSQDPNSLWLAGVALNRPVSKEEAIVHWTENGGPQSFASRFPDAEAVMRFFCRLHRLHKGPLSLNHPIKG